MQHVNTSGSIYFGLSNPFYYFIILSETPFNSNLKSNIPASRPAPEHADHQPGLISSPFFLYSLNRSPIPYLSTKINALETRAQAHNLITYLLPEARQIMINRCGDCRFFICIQGTWEQHKGCVASVRKYRSLAVRVPTVIGVMKLLQSEGKEGLA
jgi:hypothetical protein